MSWKRKIKIAFGILLMLLFVFSLQLTPIQQYVSIPNNVTLFQSEQLTSIPKLTSIVTHNNEVINDSKLNPQHVGESEVVYKVGKVPVKKVDLTVLEDHEVVPGGQSIGVQLHTLGVLVVGHHLVNHVDKTTSPAEHADIKVGDIIVKMNGKKIKQLDDLKQMVQSAGKNDEKLDITLKRGEELVKTELSPTYNKEEDSYQIGVYIRDSTTGIGTVSFYDRVTGNYGALGHVISDADTKKPLEIHKGKIVHSSITHIEKGNRGLPGEKQAKFSMKAKSIGTIEKNSPFGIFGKIDPSKMKEQQKPLPIGLSNEVKKGPAEILTVIEGDEVEKFSIEIVNSVPQSYPSTKGMIIKVTDEKLLDKTGGIVQGMSGSPIIQNGKLVGAVTHVFVNDPTSGYGVHIEWMLQEANIQLFEQNEQTYAEAL